MKLLILLLWLLFGYIGCRIAGISHEYMYLHIGDAFFLIGCGRGGADWDNVVYPFIQQLFKDSNIRVEIWRLDKG